MSAPVEEERERDATVCCSFFFVSGFCFLSVARSASSFFVYTFPSFSVPSGLPARIHQASRLLCLFAAAAPVDPGVAVTLPFDKWQP